AISSARRARSWPRTSARSVTGGASSGAGAAAASSATSGSPWPSRRYRHTDSRLAAARALAWRSRATSPALPSGTIRVWPSVPQRMAAGSTPCTGRRAPERASSPRNSCPSRRSRGTCPLAARMPRAMARSKRQPSLGRSAGARLTVTRPAGNSSFALWMAARTRSRASFTTVSASPTMVVPGRPPPRCTSTMTGGAWTPSWARLATTAKPMRLLPAQALQLRLQRVNAGAQLFQLFTGVQQHLPLHLVVVPADQVEPVQLRADGGTQVAAQVARALLQAGRQQFADALTQGFDVLGTDHGEPRRVDSLREGG